MKKALPLIIIALILTVGVAGYFVWKHLDKKNQGTPAPIPTPTSENTSNPTSLGTSPGLESAPEIFIKKPLWIEPVPVVRQPKPQKRVLTIPTIERFEKLNFNSL